MLNETGDVKHLNEGRGETFPIAAKEPLGRKSWRRLCVCGKISFVIRLFDRLFLNFSFLPIPGIHFSEIGDRWRHTETKKQRNTKYAQRRYVFCWSVHTMLYNNIALYSTTTLLEMLTVDIINIISMSLAYEKFHKKLSLLLVR